MLTDEDRQLGHRLAGEWLEANGERDPMVLAEHFERGDRPRRAFRWYLRASEQALEGNDFEATHGRCERAMPCAPDEVARGRLDLLRAEASRWQGVHKETIEHGVSAMKRLASGSAMWFQSAGLAAIAAGNTGDSDELARIGTALLGAEPAGDAIASYLIALSRVGDRMMIVGKYAAAEPLLERMREFSGHEANQVPDVAGWIHRIRGFHALLLGDPATFASEMLEAARCFETAGDIRNACLQRGNAGYGYLHVGDYALAEAVLREALVAARELDLGNVMSSVTVDLGLTLTRLGQVGEAIAVLEDAVGRCQAQSSHRLLGCAYAYLALARLRAGDTSGAEKAAASAIEDTRAHPPARATALAAMAAVQLARGENAEALRAANRAMAQLQLLGDVNEGEALVRVTYAEALRAAGQPRAAAEAIRAAQQRLEARAAALGDPRFRECFLASEESSLRTAALYRELVGSLEPTAGR
jgi:tetratricopeptide (TPR) repeat protein